MNSIVQYEAVKTQLRPGDLVFYWGSGLLSRLIELLSGNGPSHVQIVEAVLPDGTVMIAESTIENGASGVQRHALAESIAGYPAGSKCGAMLLDDFTRARADWTKLTPYIDALVAGKLGYDVLGLLKFLAPEGLRESQANDRKTLCSSFIAAVYQELGILFAVPVSQVSPQWLISMRIYKLFVALMGKPKPRNVGAF